MCEGAVNALRDKGFEILETAEEWPEFVLRDVGALCVPPAGDPVADSGLRRRPLRAGAASSGQADPHARPIRGPRSPLPDPREASAPVATFRSAGSGMRRSGSSGIKTGSGSPSIKRSSRRPAWSRFEPAANATPLRLIRTSPGATSDRISPAAELAFSNGSIAPTSTTRSSAHTDRLRKRSPRAGHPPSRSSGSCNR